MAKWPSKEEEDNRHFQTTALKTICELRAVIEELVDNWGKMLPLKAKAIADEEKRHRREASMMLDFAAKIEEEHRKQELLEAETQIEILKTKIKRLKNGE